MCEKVRPDCLFHHDDWGTPLSAPKQHRRNIRHGESEGIIPFSRLQFSSAVGT
ncbi:MAG: hypothetical protein HFI88_09805 [Lachnospiraceae bacterium]|nr:hypothetical protein [Lachnospiraceae bacterium]